MRRRLRILLICAALPLALSCEEQADVEVTLREELRHANGLAVLRPDGFRAIEEAAGFAFVEEGMIRAPHYLRILRLEQAPPQAPQGSRKLESGASASCAVARRSGGSAGNEYELTAWRAAGDSWILVSEIAQSEMGEPNFATAWALIDQARIAGSSE